MGFLWSYGIGFCVIFIGFFLWKKWSNLVKRFVPSEESIAISGCDSGIGFYCAHLYDQMGFRVFAGCLMPDGQGARELVNQCSSRLTIVHLDVTCEQSVKRFYDIIHRQVQNYGLWGLVNNAGVLCYGEFEWLTWKQCELQVQVNLVGAIRFTKVLLPLVRLRKGRILTITSVNGLVAYPALTVYCATKFGLEGFCNSLRLELEKHGVYVSALQLGDFARLTNILASHQFNVSEMWQNMSQELRDSQGEYFKRFHKVVKLRHGLSSPKSMEKSQLTTDLTDFALAPKPRPRYLCMSFAQRCFFRLLLILPSSFTDSFISYLFIKVFNWKSD
ncbi:Dehydrogenase/reductase SDR member 9 [Chamberlinius hualienensis]